MTLNEALVSLYYGDKIKLPEWGGYWIKSAAPYANGLIEVNLKTGEKVYTPDFAQYGDRDDWEVMVAPE